MATLKQNNDWIRTLLQSLGPMQSEFKADSCVRHFAYASRKVFEICSASGPRLRSLIVTESKCYLFRRAESSRQELPMQTRQRYQLVLKQLKYRYMSAENMHRSYM